MNAIVGVGPVGLLVAALLERAGADFVFLSRDSENSRRMGELLESSGVPIEALGGELNGGLVKGRVRPLGSAKVERIYLCTPHTAFPPVLKAMDLSETKEIVLLNSGLCTSISLGQHCPEGLRIRSFSNFFAAAKLVGDKLHLKAVKKRVYLSQGEPFELQEELVALGVDVQMVQSAIEAELRNITLFSHTIFGLAPSTLECVLGLTEIPRFLYKLCPEGPIERRRTRLYATFFEDLMRLAKRMGGKPFNLLDFLHNDNYPVSEGFLTQEEVASFPDLDLQRQGDLIFARYAGLLVDPNSTPDSAGRYFDFSAVPVGRARLVRGELQMPRVQAEELYHLQLLRLLAARLVTKMPSVEQIWGEVSAIKARLPEAKAQAFEKLLDSLGEQAMQALGEEEASQ